MQFQIILIIIQFNILLLGLKYDEHTPLNVASSEKDANNLWSLADVKPILQKQLGVSDLHEVFSQNR